MFGLSGNAGGLGEAVRVRADDADCLEAGESGGDHETPRVPDTKPPRVNLEPGGLTWHN